MSKLFTVAAGYLEEGLLETRMHGKHILLTCAQQLLAEEQLATLLEALPRAAMAKKVKEVLTLSHAQY